MRIVVKIYTASFGVSRPPGAVREARVQARKPQLFNGHWLTPVKIVEAENCGVELNVFDVHENTTWARGWKTVGAKALRALIALENSAS
jgi:hypothetical protein